MRRSDANADCTRDVHVKQKSAAILDENLIIQKNCHKMAAISDLGVQQSLTGGDKSCVQLIFGLGAAAVAAMPQSGGEIFFGI